eukprot:scaffold93818_cov62-Phaeocystis_antarctica.AAC.2
MCIRAAWWVARASRSSPQTRRMPLAPAPCVYSRKGVCTKLPRSAATVVAHRGTPSAMLRGSRSSTDSVRMWEGSTGRKARASPCLCPHGMLCTVGGCGASCPMACVNKARAVIRIHAHSAAVSDAAGSRNAATANGVCSVAASNQAVWPRRRSISTPYEAGCCTMLMCLLFTNAKLKSSSPLALTPDVHTKSCPSL